MTIFNFASYNTSEFDTFRKQGFSNSQSNMIHLKSLLTVDLIQRLPGEADYAMVSPVISLEGLLMKLMDHGYRFKLSIDTPAPIIEDITLDKKPMDS